MNSKQRRVFDRAVARLIGETDLRGVSTVHRAWLQRWSMEPPVFVRSQRSLRADTDISAAPKCMRPWKWNPRIHRWDHGPRSHANRRAARRKAYILQRFGPIKPLARIMGHGWWSHPKYLERRPRTSKALELRRYRYLRSWSRGYGTSWVPPSRDDCEGLASDMVASLTREPSTSRGGTVEPGATRLWTWTLQENASRLGIKVAVSGGWPLVTVRMRDRTVFATSGSLADGLDIWEHGCAGDTIQCFVANVSDQAITVQLALAVTKAPVCHVFVRTGA